MKLVELKPAVTPANSDALGRLWEAAERYGKVELGHPLGSDDYRAEIMFRRQSGSTVFARGVHRIKEEALRLAIDEAIELGAQLLGSGR